jgi:hypothetical protein
MQAICSKCRIEKNLTEYKKDKSKKLGRSSQCKECQKPYAKIYQLKNLDKWGEYTKKWRNLNLEKSKYLNDSWYQENKEKHSKVMKEWNNANPNYMKEWYSKNKEEFNKNKRERWNNDLAFRLKSNIRTRIYKSIKNKSNKSLELLGCNIKEYFIYLENKFTSEMNWDNYGNYWEIDHIIPLSKGGSFHFTNTQPLTINENRSKGNKI